jgi:DNA-binding CsgD family transcriptional regulator
MRERRFYDRLGMGTQAGVAPSATGGRLLGRVSECELLERLLDGARSGSSDALVLYGEPGIGKTVLLEHAVEQAAEMRVLRVTGLEAASDLPYGGLATLLRPVLAVLPEIPDRQRAALSTALGLAPAGEPRPLAVAAGTLSLLAAVAETEPLLCVVDDAHWIDRESVEALAVVAARLEAEGIVILFAARDGEGFEPAQLAALHLTGLDPDAAGTLLRRHAPRAVTSGVAERLVSETRGNPLALLELPALLTDAQFSGREPLDRPLPVGASLEQAFARRVGALPGEAQRAILVAAASDSDDLGLVIRAAGELGLPADALEAADSAGLLSIRGWRFRFRHPLVRSALYQAAPLAERRAVHGALAGVLGEKGDIERRAWHRAAAALGPDEDVAAELERAAASARRRGGVAAEARTLELAARLAPADDARAARLVKAADAAGQAGQSDQAGRLLDEALPQIGDPVLRADAQELRASILKRRGEAEAAHELLLDEASRIESADPLRAARMLTRASHLFFRRDQIAPALELAERAWWLVGREVAADDLELSGTLAWAQAYLGRTEEARALALRCAEISEARGETAGGPQIGWCLSWLEEYEAARAPIERAVRAHREAGAFGDLAYVLFHLSDLELRTGRLAAAYAAAQEGARLAREIGRDQLLMADLTVLATVEAVLGRADDSRTHATQALALAGATFNHTFVARANAALGLLELSLGRSQEAVAVLELVERSMAQSDVVEPSLLEWIPDLIEAYIRVDRIDDALLRLERWDGLAIQTRRLWALAAAARYRGLLAAEGEAEARFEEAIALHERTPSAFERARTRLCYGERLRRAGRRAEARTHLRLALEAFERLGAVPWAERARTELHATGETVRRRDPTAAERLTPQELQIALAVGEGRTNREVAAALFLSPKTIEYHLANVYRKLDVHTRAQLANRLARDGTLGEAAPSLGEARGRRRLPK